MQTDIHFTRPTSQRPAVPAPAKLPVRAPELTPKQAIALDWLCSRFEADGAVPSFRELAAHLHVRKSTAEYFFWRLTDKGFLAPVGNQEARTRVYRILKRSDGVPVRPRLVPNQ